MIIFDTESDDLLEGATKIWIMSWTSDGEKFHSTSDYDHMREVLDKSPYAGCHNSFRHDFPLFEKILGYNYKGLKIDTLFMSWDLYAERPKHGLESWGEDLGFPKVEVEKEEWSKGDWNVMMERCERDVLINWRLWKKLEGYYKELYG